MKMKVTRLPGGPCETRSGSDIDYGPLLAIVREIHDRLPFNRVLGITIEYLGTDEACTSFSMRDDLIGNSVHGMLHGGVVSAVLDATGGVTACASAAQKMVGLSREEVVHRVSRIGTIDMRVDYLRPGKGSRFLCTGTVMRSGRKVAVIRMELRNEEDTLIAVGTGAYIVG
jgi:uncharacterized protein (TIGR00369 family)